MRVLVVGAKGMLGSDVVTAFDVAGHEVVGLDLPELDITDPMSTAQIASGQLGQFDWAVNGAAYTAVDRAESEKDDAYRVNALGVSYLAQACQMAKIRLIHIGTDFVFDGQKNAPYVETDRANPIGIYAESKLEGEKAALSQGAIVLRTAWLFGPNGPSFPRTMIRAWLEGKSLRVVADQIGSPTYTEELARMIVDSTDSNLEPGLYHAAGPEAMSWYDLAIRAITTYRDVVLKEDRPITIQAIRTEDWPTAARRPKYSVLDSGKLEALVNPMEAFDSSLVRFVQRLENQPK
ncbi:MAG TPA: dTDP-4-dehydrorhamnose reductase [Fimbriimonadaceae bacterium]|nr:dTDP-4-dehydrorhamnose reductase [Fimbriimonadaceae bacterium]